MIADTFIFIVIIIIIVIIVIIIIINVILGTYNIRKEEKYPYNFFEFFSHLILLYILILGFNLSRVINIDSAIYSVVPITIPNSLFLIKGTNNTNSDISSNSNTKIDNNNFGKNYQSIFSGVNIYYYYY